MPLIYYGHPFLRQRAQEVPQVDQEVRELIGEMIEVMRVHHGCGIAAPMVGASIRVIVVRLDQLTEEERVVEGEILPLINPKLSSPSSETWVMEEGNLSIPGIRVPVERPCRITVDALDVEGHPIHLELEGLAARIAMHENDVLNGVLMFDRAAKSERRRIAPALRVLASKFSAK